MEQLLCPWDAPNWLFFSENVPNMLFYSHFTALLAIFIIGSFLFFKDRKNLTVRILTGLFILFFVWTIIDVIIWATNRSDLVLFLWAMIVLIEPIIYILAFYTLFSFSYNKTPAFIINLFVTLLLLPLILFIPTNLNLSGINLYDCNAIEGPLASVYTYFLEILFIFGIIFVATKKIVSLETRKERVKILFFALGLLAFLAAFASGNIIGSVTGDWILAQYGLLGMPIFVGFLTYLIVEYKIYNLNILGAQALIVTLWFLIGSLLFVAQSIQTKIVSGFTLLVAVVLGIILVRSIKNTVHQREEIEKLAIKLEKTNVRLKILDKQKSEFVSIASHQLRSPLTSIRGYISMMQEGSFGAVTAKMIEPLQRINESASMMATSIEDFLSVSRIESGNMKYEYSDFNLRDQAEHIVDDLRPEALKKGLLLLFRTDLNCQGIVKADVGKIQQILHNLINNSLKYTPKGTITVYVHDDKKRKLLYVEIIDTGIGMSQVTIDSLFEKFTRAQNANSVNIKGTGLGLFIAREMARAMKGDVTAHSEGEGKGSHFIFTIPFQQ
ncbi:hypothetical protein A2592_00815 [Candidatus Kaiserbacteria bacterium RIFOXYD1_FULL_42_15]|uniref:histidine kinase n=1 Tax=Candidatus Kaiserbacteria bacterium RIFOXYD1_FULL_42_15 TaxID=1798532 RepID=A0A1F6FR50_9BACT|nr:MAG: hypothetical protein A2592_00815 [Candidatus Kaiserbacteria bacterium RIFOXYD1_FULL_42_15]